MSNFRILRTVLVLSIIQLFNGMLFAQFPSYPEVKFIVFSDPHYYDPSLGMEGKEFESYIANDRKLLRESREILESAVSDIEKSDADFVLVSGDLTKDGERINHEKFAEFLARIENSGKKVYVVPGNHDILNPHAFRYGMDAKEAVPSVSPEEFKEIYSRFGYEEAIIRDEYSLSYVTEPVEGLWLLCLDACRYRENEPGGDPVTGGKISDQTMIWIQEVLMKSKENNKAVVTMMHHGILEHYKGQKKFYGEYVADNYKKLSKLLASFGADIALTGHFHAQDITIERYGNGNFILDIETGSLVTYPCPYRTIRISNDQNLSVKSSFVRSIPSRPDFEKYAGNYVHKGIAGIAANTLISMKVDSTESWALSGQVADAFVAHYKGDEIAPENPFDLEGISLKGRFLIGFKKNLVKSLHHDLEPADNDLQIKIR